MTKSKPSKSESYSCLTLYSLQGLNNHTVSYDEHFTPFCGWESSSLFPMFVAKWKCNKSVKETSIILMIFQTFSVCIWKRCTQVYNVYTLMIREMQKRVAFREWMNSQLGVRVLKLPVFKKKVCSKKEGCFPFFCFKWNPVEGLNYEAKLHNKFLFIWVFFPQRVNPFKGMFWKPVAMW